MHPLLSVALFVIGAITGWLARHYRAEQQTAFCKWAAELDPRALITTSQIVQRARQALGKD